MRRMCGLKGPLTHNQISPSSGLSSLSFVAEEPRVTCGAPLGFCEVRQRRIAETHIENRPLRHASRHHLLGPSSLRPYYDRVPRPYHPSVCRRTKLDNRPCVVSRKDNHLGNAHDPARDLGTSNTGRRESRGGHDRDLFPGHSQNGDVFRMALCVCDSRSIHRLSAVRGVSPVH